MNNFFIGLMSGTSADSVDAVLVNIVDSNIRYIGKYSHPIPLRLKTAIYRLVEDKILDGNEIDSLDIDLGEIFSETVNALLRQESVTAESIVAIGSHGQTIKHSPDSSQPFSLQIGNGELISKKTGIRTVWDFRSADIAAGGQGAPLTPLFNEHVFAQDKNKKAIINIGGISNITLLSPHLSTIGYDIGPGNCLMDSWSRENDMGQFDEDGKWASSGQTNQALLDAMLGETYFSKNFPKSTGPDYFNLSWVNGLKQKTGEIPTPEDLQSTLLDLTVESLTGEIKKLELDCPKAIFFCGGGIHNKYLMIKIQEKLSSKIYTTKELGIDPDYIEATSFAWFACQRVQERSFDLSKITGSKGKVLLGEIAEPK